LFQNGLQSFQTFDAMLSVSALPCKKKSIKILGRDRLNFRAQAINRQAMNSREQSAVAPFLFGGVGVKFSAKNKTFAFQSEQSGFNVRSRPAENFLQLRFGDRSRNLDSTAEQFPNCICTRCSLTCRFAASSPSGRGER